MQEGHVCSYYCQEGVHCVPIYSDARTSPREGAVLWGEVYGDQFVAFQAAREAHDDVQARAAAGCGLTTATQAPWAPFLLFVRGPLLTHRACITRLLTLWDAWRMEGPRPTVVGLDGLVGIHRKGQA